MRKRVIPTIASAAAAALLALSCVGCTTPDEPAAPEQRFTDSDIMPEYLLGYYALQAGDAAPDFTAEIVDENGCTGETLTLADLAGKVAVIEGVDCFEGAPIQACDLRAGAAMVVAGLAASGVTEVSDIHHIERGYEDFVEKLTGLGACIQRVETPDGDELDQAN